MSKKIRVSLTGTHGTGKTHITTEIAHRLNDLEIECHTIGSATRHVKSHGLEINEEGTWRTQLLSGTTRYLWQKDIQRLQSVVESEDTPSVFIADRCLLDEVCYSQYFLNKDPEGDFARSALQTLKGLWYSDHREAYWDRVFYKPVHPDHAIELDGDRVGDAEFQSGVDRCFLRWGDVYENQLPPDRDEAVEVVWSYLMKELNT